MSTLKKPDLSDPKLRAKLAKGMGHNYYGPIPLANFALNFGSDKSGFFNVDI